MPTILQEIVSAWRFTQILPRSPVTCNPDSGKLEIKYALVQLLYTVSFSIFYLFFFNFFYLNFIIIIFYYFLFFLLFYLMFCFDWK